MAGKAVEECEECGLDVAQDRHHDGKKIGQTLAKWFKTRSPPSPPASSGTPFNGADKCSSWRPWRCLSKSDSRGDHGTCSAELCKRALPPVSDLQHHLIHVPSDGTADSLASHDAVAPGVDSDSCSNNNLDFASSIDSVKNCGWYWGPISGPAAERLLQNEPDGSFLVRDSSDQHYIFSLTFRLSGTIRHVRIEHKQGNFSFGSFTNFKSHTIVDFIENAVQHSRSGRFLFFLNRRPVIGPMRVQLLHPVSRFKQVQSLQHLCRFVILKLVPRDNVQRLPVPRRIQDYLNTPFYYSEAVAHSEMGLQQPEPEVPLGADGSLPGVD